VKQEEFEDTKGAKTNDALTLYLRYNRTGNKDSNTHTITTEVKINKFSALILCNKDSNTHSITTELKINKFNALILCTFILRNIRFNIRINTDSPAERVT
jgi:hypothetical protein